MSIGSVHSIDVTEYFSNTYTSGCKLKSFNILKVIANDSIIDSSQYSSLFSLSSLGKFVTTSQTSQQIENYLIYIQAFNSMIWGGGTSYVIDLSLY
jgi:hypothetical protein